MPTIIRADKGTENGVIGELQMVLRLSHSDQLSGARSFIQGKSVHNVKIESFWGELRQHSIDFYTQLFKTMVEQNLFDGSTLHIRCLQFCFGALIKNDLEMTKKLWNEHSIRKQNGRRHVHEKQFVLYYTAEKNNVKDYKKTVDLEVIDRLTALYCTEPKFFDSEFQEVVDMLYPNCPVPADASEAVNLYKKILRSISENR